MEEEGNLARTIPTSNGSNKSENQKEKTNSAYYYKRIFKNMYIFCLKVAVWILPEARVQTVGTR